MRVKRGDSLLRLLIVLIILLGSCEPAAAQCVVMSIVVDGKVHSAGNQVKVMVRVHANRGEKVSESTAAPREDSFHITVPFDTFVSVHFFGAHNCSRRPTTADVLLVVGGAVKRTIKLSIKDDFTWDQKRDEWRVKAPLTL